MFKITVLGSGSGGNCTLVEGDGTRVLVDAGFSGKEIRERLLQVGCTPEGLDAVLLTHEHGDHTKGLPALCGRMNIPLYCNKLTGEAVEEALPKFSHWRYFATGDAFPIKNFTIQSFMIPHDAQDPVGFVIRQGALAFGFATDLGHATHLVTERIRGCNAMVLESNYDLQMLQQDTKRPWDVKRRIQNRHGHLSNEDAAALAAEVAHAGLQHILLGHLSGDCNTPELALRATTSALQEKHPHIRIAVLAQDQVNPSVDLEANNPNVPQNLSR